MSLYINKKTADDLRAQLGVLTCAYNATDDKKQRKQIQRARWYVLFLLDNTVPFKIGLLASLGFIIILSAIGYDQSHTIADLQQQKSNYEDLAHEFCVSASGGEMQICKEVLSDGK